MITLPEWNHHQLIAIAFHSDYRKRQLNMEFCPTPLALCNACSVFISLRPRNCACKQTTQGWTVVHPSLAWTRQGTEGSASEFRSLYFSIPGYPLLFWVQVVF